MRVSIEPGNDLVGRFGDTVVLISRGDGTDASANELVGLVADLAADREATATTVAARLAGWVLGHIAGDVPPFGIVAPVPDGVVVFLRGPVRCTVSASDGVRNLSGEQALTWVDQILPGNFDWLAIGGVEGTAVQADPVSDLRAGLVPGQGFVLNGLSGSGQAAPAAAAVAAVAPVAEQAPREPEVAPQPARSSCRSWTSPPCPPHPWSTLRCPAPSPAVPCRSTARSVAPAAIAGRHRPGDGGGALR